MRARRRVVWAAVARCARTVLLWCLWIGISCFRFPALAAEQRPHITGVSHIALFVHDVEKSRAFYKDFLGFAEPYSLTNADGSLHLTFIKINDRQSIEIFPEKAPGTDRLNHIALETDDAEAMRSYLVSRGVKAPEKVGKGRIGNLNFNVTDPDGHTVEIVQYAPDSWSVREKGNGTYNPCTSPERRPETDDCSRPDHKESNGPELIHMRQEEEEASVFDEWRKSPLGEEAQGECHHAKHGAEPS